MTGRFGFTLIELIITITVVAVIGAVAAPFGGAFLLRTDLTLAAERLEGVLRQAREYARTNRSGGAWGVCLTGDVFRLYRGSCESPAYAEEVTLPRGVTASGLGDVAFAGGTGLPESTIEIALVTSLGERTVGMNRVGAVILSE